MRILQIIRSVDPRGGGPIEGVVRQNAALGSDGVREIVSLDPPDAPFLKDLPIAVHPMGVTPYDEIGRSKLAAFGYSPRLIPWLKENARAYDCAVVNGLWNYAAVGPSRVLPKGELPYFVFSHGMMDPWFRKTYPIKHQVKQASWLLFEGRLAAGAEAVLFTTEEERTLAEGQFVGHAYRGEIMRYGTSAPSGEPEADARAFREACPSLGGRPYLLFLSRIHPKKGCDLLIRAFAAVASSEPDMQLVMAGPDQTDWAAQLKVEANRLGVGARVHWPGMLQGSAKWGAFRCAEAFVLPSHQENFGIVVAESLACGAPVLISDKVNIWREIVASDAGYVAPDDEAGTVSLLRRWMATPASARRHMRAQARAAFEAFFDVRLAAQDLLQRMEAAVNKPASRNRALRGAEASPPSV